jgi:hypothetical protein
MPSALNSHFNWSVSIFLTNYFQMAWIHHGWESRDLERDDLNTIKKLRKSIKSLIIVSPGRYLYPIPPEYKSRMLPPHLHTRTLVCLLRAVLSLTMKRRLATSRGWAWGTGTGQLRTGTWAASWDLKQTKQRQLILQREHWPLTKET